jgi:hypothetical protein
MLFDNDSMVAYYANLYGCDDEVDDLMTKDVEIKRAIFFSRLRSSLYRKIISQVGGLEQWLFITGKKSKTSDGRSIRLSLHSVRVLEEIVAWCESTDGMIELVRVGVTAPEHPDDVVNWVQEALTSKELSKYTFKFALQKFRREYIG